MKLNTKRIFRVFLYSLCFLSLSTLGSTGLAAEGVAVAGISIDTTSIEMQASDTHVLNAQVDPSDASNQNIVWTSSDDSVAVVDDGEVTAFSEGTAVITASSQENPDINVSCQVTVTPLVPVSASETIRIKLSMGAITTMPFYLDGSYSIAEAPAVSLPRQFYNIKLESNTLRLYYGDTILASGTQLTLVQHEALDYDNNFLWINHPSYGTRRYLGDMKFTIADSAIQVVNHIYLEEYLWGVVPHEMSNSFPIEALKAQAVAARTYAVRNMGGGEYDFGDTSASQVYKGYHPGNDVAIAAVNATSKMVLQVGSSAIAATYYSASNGGYTEIPLHTWGGGSTMPYYIEYDMYDVLNPSSPYEQVFFPVLIDETHPVTASDNVTGSPNIDNAILYFKTAIFNSNQLQNAGYDVSSVNDFELTGLLDIVQHTHDAGGSEDHSRMPSTGVNDCPDYIMATASFRVNATKGGTAEEAIISGVELDMRYFDGANDDDTYRVFNFTSLRLTIAEPVYEEGVLSGFSIYHRRYGHGIGLSQRGAQQRANAGQTFQQILSFYYPETGAAILDIAKAPLTSIDPPADNSNATVICNDYLSVRETASTSAARIFTLPPNARIEVVQEDYSSTFHMINFGGRNYFVYSVYVIIDEPQPVTGVTLDAEEINLNKGDSHTLTATIAPEDASDKSVTWTSSDAGIASVDASGVVTALSTGTAIISVRTASGGFEDTCIVNVETKVEGINISPLSHKMLIDDTFQINISITPADADNQNVSFSSSDISIAEVDASGIVTAHAIGSAIITAETEDGSFTAQCHVSVVQEMITSDTYFVNRDLEYYEDVAIDSSYQDIIDSVNNTYGEVQIFDTNMNPVTDGNVSTGYYVQLIIEGEVVDSLRIIIEGDCNPDTILDIVDYTLIRLHILDVAQMSGIYLESADVNDDGTIDIIDYTLVRLHILDLVPLY
ncbi:MAG: SpoIID/LytB domain-containing protein [Eubacteriales bacterium]